MRNERLPQGWTTMEAEKYTIGTITTARFYNTMSGVFGAEIQAEVITRQDGAICCRFHVPEEELVKVGDADNPPEPDPTQDFWVLLTPVRN